MSTERYKAAADLLQAHNAWRRGADGNDRLQNVKALGEAIDTAIDALRAAAPEVATDPAVQTLLAAQWGFVPAKRELGDEMTLDQHVEFASALEIRRALSIVERIDKLADDNDPDRMSPHWCGWSSACEEIAELIRTEVSVLPGGMVLPISGTMPSTRQPAHPAPRQEPPAPSELRRAVRAMAAMLSNGEWAEHVSSDPDASELESQITALHSQLGELQDGAAPQDGSKAPAADSARLWWLLDNWWFCAASPELKYDIGQALSPDEVIAVIDKHRAAPIRPFTLAEQSSSGVPEPAAAPIRDAQDAASQGQA